MLRGSIVVLIILGPLRRNVGRAGSGRSLSARPALCQGQGRHQVPTQRMSRRYEGPDQGAQAAVTTTALQQGAAPTERERGTACSETNPGWPAVLYRSVPRIELPAGHDRPVVDGGPQGRLQEERELFFEELSHTAHRSRHVDLQDDVADRYEGLSHGAGGKIDRHPCVDSCTYEARA